MPVVYVCTYSGGGMNIITIDNRKEDRETIFQQPGMRCAQAKEKLETRMGAGYWWGCERTSRCVARCCLDVAKHKPANHHHLFPSSFSFLFRWFHSVCVVPFCTKIHIRRCCSVGGPKVMGFRLSPLPHIMHRDQTNFFLFPKCVSFVCTITRRMIFRSWPATLAISSHANTTNTHTAPSTHLLSHSLGWEWQLEKWWKMDLFCPPCNVWRRDIFCHPRVISILYGTLDATIVVVQEREIESLHFILWYVGWWFDISADILAI